MRWYYANDNHRQGPVSDSELARLAREGVIRDDTLVWRQGLKDWQRYAEVAPPPTPPDLPPPLGTADIEPSLPGAAEVLAALPPALNYAGFWLRAAAKIIDWLVLMGLGRLLVHAMGLSEIDIMPLASGDVAELVPLMQQLGGLFLADSAMRLAYYWYFMRRYAATPGKLALGLKVVRSDGSALSHGRIFARFFAEVVSKYFTLGIGYLLAAFDEEKRTMHDQICDTRVVMKRRR